jgi:hypothetical protein
MFELGINEKQPLAARYLAWAAGAITDDELDKDIECYLPNES